MQTQINSEIRKRKVHRVLMNKQDYSERAA